MKKLFFAVVAMLFAACTTDVTEDVAVKLPETLTVSFEESSRIQLNEGKTVWTAGDLVSVFYRSDANQQWKFNGQTGATTAELTKVTEPEATNTLSKVVTIYPYNENYTIDAECKVTATLPAEQEYLADSFGVGSSIMVAESESNNAQLRNAMGWLRLHLTGDGEVVKSITVKGNNSEQVAGQITINPSDATITLAESSTATTVTLNCTDGVTLSSEETAFYIALPPQKFEGGITAEINCNDGSKMVKSTSNSVTIKRNTILPMEELGYHADIPHNQIWYTATTKIEPNNAFNVTIKSNEWNEITGEGIITFNGDVTEIGSWAFSGCNLTSIIIPNSVTSLGANPFRDCSKLAEFNGKFASTDKRCLIVDGELNSFAPAGLIEYTIPNSVTKIGSTAFSYCSNLVSITIPNSVISVEGNPFFACSQLTEFNGKFASTDKRCLAVNGVLNSFAPAGLTEYTIPDNITKIGDSAFRNCDMIISITIPDSVIEIGSFTFSNCSSLTSITIPDGVTKIDWAAFKSCESLTSITIPCNVIKIGTAAFESCTNLKDIYCMPITPPSLGGYAFQNYENGEYLNLNCAIHVPSIAINDYRNDDSWEMYNIVANNEVIYTTIDSKIVTLYKNSTLFDANIISNVYYTHNNIGIITFDAPITKIQGRSFYYCTNLAAISIPDSVTKIGYDAFLGCKSLESITIPNSVAEIGSYAFSECHKLTKINIPNSVISIGSSAFSWCKGLAEFSGNFASADKRCLIINGVLNSFAPAGITEYTIPYNTTTIDDDVFYFCSNLTNITIPDSVTKIGHRAFVSCSNLNSITIPSKVTEIGYDTFDYCRNLKNVYCKPTTPPQVGSSIFSDNATDRKIYVPASDDDSIINAYKAADYWKDYADYIEEYDFTE